MSWVRRRTGEGTMKNSQFHLIMINLLAIISLLMEPGFTSTIILIMGLFFGLFFIVDLFQEHKESKKKYVKERKTEGEHGN